jgi:cyclophilin family peptidyl-prolyl cis-trans isomerase
MRKGSFAGIVVAVVLAVGLAGCGGSSKGKASASGVSCTAAGQPGATAAISVSIGGTGAGCIVIALDTKNAPKAAGRFISLAKSRFYDGLTFHRAVPNFVIQAGDPNGDGSGGSGKPPVLGEVPKDGYPIGSLAAAKTATDPDGTFDSQFFIVTGAQGTQLPPQYARFGRVVAGMEVAKRIEALAPPTGDGPPTQKVTMDKVTIAGA